MYNMYICLLDIKYTSNVHDVMLKLDLYSIFAKCIICIFNFCVVLKSHVVDCECGNREPNPNP